MAPFKRMKRDFPGGPGAKNPPSNAGDADSIPGQGNKIPCAARRLSPHTPAAEPTLQSWSTWNERGLRQPAGMNEGCWVGCMDRSESSGHV